MIVVAGTFRVPPEKLEALRPHAQAVIAATRGEPGCIAYSFAEDLADPGLIRIYEEWRSLDDLQAHAKSAHMAPWRAALAEIGASGRDLKRYEAGEATPL
ncbi:MAG TPA: putative quinol monooxygenase [Afifellaceae bacterium]|nr:putative quinol monooxygenase [Afifellaceae bacterium]